MHQALICCSCFICVSSCSLCHQARLNPMHVGQKRNTVRFNGITQRRRKRFSLFQMSYFNSLYNSLTLSLLLFPFCYSFICSFSCRGVIITAHSASIALFLIGMCWMSQYNLNDPSGTIPLSAVFRKPKMLALFLIQGHRFLCFAFLLFWLWRKLSRTREIPLSPILNWSVTQTNWWSSMF